MSFVVVLSCFLSLLVGGTAFFLFRRRRWRAIVIAGIVLIAAPIWFLHPVCVPLSVEDIALFDPPIESRTQTGLTGQRIFQEREGDWFQCKTWIARSLFF